MKPLFAPNETLASGRIRLGPLTPDSFDAMSVWLADAVSPEWSLGDLRCASESSEGVLISDRDASPIGMAVVLRRAPSPGAATVPFLAIEPGRRFRGLGGEAGIALDRRLRQGLGVARVYAPVPEGRGLAVYFWLRLGFRPLSAARSPGPLLGLTAAARPGIWMLRDEE